MPRHITAKKRLTRERVLAIVDERIRIHKELMNDPIYGEHGSEYSRHCLRELQQLRDDIAWACEVGVFPSSK